ncbi:hypothetical protein Tco_0697635 [Tanacetum coccineum]
MSRININKKSSNSNNIKKAFNPNTWVVDLFGLQEPDSPEAAPASPDYVPVLEEPEQAPPSPDYVPSPEYLEYLAPASNEIVEDSKDGPVDYPANRGDDDDDDESSDDDEEEEEASDEEEEHLALADSIVTPAGNLVPCSEETDPFETDESAAPMPFPLETEVKRLLALPTLPPSPLISLSPPSVEECLARCLAAPTLPSSPHPIVPHPYRSPNHVCTPRGFRATRGRLRASSPSTHHPLHPSPLLPPLPSSLYLPPPIPTLLPLPSPPLPALLFIPALVNHREDIPEAELPPHKWLCLTALTSRYEVRESSTVTARPTKVIEQTMGLSVLWMPRLDVREPRRGHARVTEIAEVSFLQEQLSAALGHIEALQARDLTHTDDPKGTNSCA